MAKKVMARAMNWRAKKNHSESGPMKDNPSVLLCFTTAPPVLRRVGETIRSTASVDKCESDAAPGCPVS